VTRSSALIVVALLVMLCGCAFNLQKRGGTAAPREWQEMDQARAREAAIMRELWSARSRP
jgi:hypothetical protein